MWLPSIRDRLDGEREETWVYHKTKRRGVGRRYQEDSGGQTQHSDALNPWETTKLEASLIVVASLRFVRAIEGLRTDPRLSWHNYTR